MPERQSKPYNVWYKSGYYYFKTDHGLTYSCGFNNLTPKLPPMLNVYDIEISDIEFFPDKKPESYYPNSNTNSIGFYLLFSF